MSELERAFELARAYLDSLPERPVVAQGDAAGLRVALPDGPVDAATVVEELAAGAEAGLVASAGGRYFGFVTGSSLPAALAADWLASAWDQNTALHVMSPAAMAAEEVAGGWLVDLLGLPANASFAFVTGAQAANTTALAAARGHVLRGAGWDVEHDGLTGAPRVRVVVGEARHSTIDRSLRLLGLGAPTDVVPWSSLELGDEPTIVCAQAGDVTTGAFDPFPAIADACAAAPNAWLHVDGAFGLWAAASPSLRALCAGVERADSWTVDGHKWLNVPYDCGIVFTAHPGSHRAAFEVRAPYLVFDETTRNAMDWSPEASRRARAFAVYAALRSLGRSGVADLVDRCCAHARAFADGMRGLGGEVLNDVVLNQVVFRFADDQATTAALAAVQRSGEAWLGATTWEGCPAIRLSVSSWRTTEDDIARTVAAFAAATA